MSRRGRRKPTPLATQISRLKRKRLKRTGREKKLGDALLARVQHAWETVTAKPHLRAVRGGRGFAVVFPKGQIPSIAALEGPPPEEGELLRSETFPWGAEFQVYRLVEETAQTCRIEVISFLPIGLEDIEIVAGGISFKDVEEYLELTSLLHRHPELDDDGKIRANSPSSAEAPKKQKPSLVQLSRGTLRYMRLKP